MLRQHQAKTIQNGVSQVWPFAHEINAALLVLPMKSLATIYIGEVTDDYHFEATGPDPFFHWRSVKWICEAIPPQDGAAQWAAGHPRNALIEAIRGQGWLSWSRNSGYSLRALAENTMFRIKRLTGAHLACRLPETQTAEVLARIAVLNVMTGLGMPVSIRNPSTV